MSSIEIARAVLMGTEPEQRVTVEWHKQEPYSVRIIEAQPDTVWRVVEDKRFVTMGEALRRFIRIVHKHWSTPQ